MKNGLHRRWRAVFCIGVLVLAAAVAAAVFLPTRPMVEPADNPSVGFVSADFGRDGETYSADIPGSELPDGVEDALIDLFLGAEMRNRVFSPPETYTVSDSSVHICVKVQLDGGEHQSMFVNLSSRPGYDSAQFGDTHYQIVGHQKLYQEVYALLSDVISAHAIKR